jgi:hypothetical protein
VPLWAQVLIAKKDHQPIHERIMNFLELLIAKRFGQVGTKDLSADTWRCVAHLNGLVGHS